MQEILSFTDFDKFKQVMSQENLEFIRQESLLTDKERGSLPDIDEQIAEIQRMESI